MSTVMPKQVFRHYWIPVGSFSAGYNRDWLLLTGALRSEPISLVEFQNSLKKAQFSEYPAVLLPENILHHPNCKDLCQQVKLSGLQLCLQFSASGLVVSLEAIRALSLDFYFKIYIILDDMPADIDSINELMSRHELQFIVPGIKDAPIWKKLKQIPAQWYKDLYFYFPHQGENKKIFKPQQINDKWTELRSLHPDFNPRVVKGFDVFEPRIHAASDLESCVRPVVQNFKSSTPQVSVVVPTYNNGSYVLNTLRHLNEQSAASDVFEVVLVDDGSTDSTSELILEQCAKFQFSFTYIYYPRMRKRKMGDSQFRAGLARNLGVKWARAECIVFLDADIIVPATFIETTLHLHKDHDVVQWRRDYLKKEVPSADIKHKDILPSRDCFIPEGGYWQDFYQKASVQQWPNVPDYWKYTCTYALSMPKSLFKDVGWFRKVYCFYGFEDTDLGLQLAKSGVRFYFNNTSVFHLYHETARSEFKNSSLYRHNLLKTSVRIFYNNTLDAEVYKVFKYLLRPFGFF